MLGYEWVKSNLYLAAEIGGTFAKNYQFHQNSSKNHQEILGGLSNTGTAITNTNVSLSGAEFNLDIKPGILAKQDLLIYGRAGMAVTSLNIADSDIWTAIPSNGKLEQATGYSKNSRNVIGVSLDLGAEYLFSKHLGVSLNYTYTTYGKITTQTSGDASDPLRNNYVQVFGANIPMVSVSTQSAYLGLTYHLLIEVFILETC